MANVNIEIVKIIKYARSKNTIKPNERWVYIYM